MKGLKGTEGRTFLCGCDGRHCYPLPCGCDRRRSCPQEERLHAAINVAYEAFMAVLRIHEGVPCEDTDELWAEYEDARARYYMHFGKVCTLEAGELIAKYLERHPDEAPAAEEAVV